ncbi:protein of unknown function (plasmid) [Azospirillum baldaniorum]|uniref:Uncharacterized protein n=1 Tax=Azospirillum baldaniorum TaxID=1064539 RepID=A0A9P1JXN7_9PROT|nr:protein of unknown function [Azospirillum baldaniorum]
MASPDMTSFFGGRAVQRAKMGPTAGSAYDATSAIRGGVNIELPSAPCAAMRSNDFRSSLDKSFHASQYAPS